MNKHILLVDDDASLRATLRACLEVAGFICTDAKDGHDARSCMEGGHPVDLIVTDHQDAKSHWFGIYQRFKESKEHRSYPDNFYSGQLTADLKAHALQAGAIAVLEKPFPLQEFLDLVAQVCEETMQ